MSPGSRNKTPAFSKAACSLRALRNRAIILLGFAGAFPRSELVALNVGDLEEVPEGLLVTIRRSKTDQEGIGRKVAIPRGEIACPVAAVRAWREAAAITSGALFVRIINRRKQRVTDRRLAARSHVIEHKGGDTAKKVVSYGQEKNRDTIHIAKMNLAVHGLEGKIAEAITYYQDEHTLAGKCDFVMANPPFNVDLVDAERIKGDPRLPFRLPGVNKAKKVSNGNYLW